MQNLMQGLQADGFYLKRSIASNNHVGSHWTTPDHSTG
jgi:hypothetical protein